VNELNRFQKVYNIGLNKIYYRIRIKHAKSKIDDIEKEFDTLFQSYIQLHDKTEKDNHDLQFNHFDYISKLFKVYPYEYKEWLGLLNEMVEKC
jgi:hypothetical protein